MPYILQEDRSDLLPKVAATNAGELNFQLTSVIAKYISAKGLRYSAINDIVGALEGCKGEFKRRVVDPYEDLKIRENGDVYTYYIFESNIETQMEALDDAT